MTADPAAPAPVLDLGGGIRVHPGILTPELVPADALTEHPRNPRRGDTDALGESVDTNGLYDQVKVQRSTGFILSGNHTYRTLVQRGATTIPVVWLDVDDREAVKVLMSANRTGDRGGYDGRLVVELLRDELDGDLAGTAYDPDEYATMIRAADVDPGPLFFGGDTLLDELRSIADPFVPDPDDTPDGDETRAPTTGERLTMADVTWGDPTRKVHHGEVWALGRHTLVVAKLHTEHQLWVHRLTPDHVFCPYPEPYLTTGEIAATHALLLIQPNPFLAGHLLDKHASVFPDDTVERTSP